MSRALKQPEPRLVAVSNRVGPIKGAASAGGLAVGLVEALRQNRGLWFGWSGRTVIGKPQLQTQKAGDLTISTVDLNPEDYEGYYNGYVNRSLWPLLHFRLDLMRCEQPDFAAYQRVNTQFAKTLKPLLRADDLVWVHDYHLFPFATALRAQRVHNRMGFFLHTPFPPPDIFASLPQHEWLARCLFDYDVIGFQTKPDLDRFNDYVRHQAGGSVRGHRVKAFGREITARAFPIGIDVDQFHEFAMQGQGEREFQRMKKSLAGRSQVIGVDRLDYSKGLLRRMAAFSEFLQNHPEAHGQMTYLQVAPVSRGEVRPYRDFRLELERAAAHINGRFGRFDWTPVHYLNRALQRKTLAGLYRASRIALVTPMRDGMNLVAKEYVAAQDPKDPGVLILSRFAGAAQQMTSAILVNPYDATGMAQAIQQALTMSLKERRARHAKLMRNLRAQDVARWRDEFVTALKDERGDAARAVRGVPSRHRQSRRK